MQKSVNAYVTQREHNTTQTQPNAESFNPNLNPTQLTQLKLNSPQHKLNTNSTLTQRKLNCKLQLKYKRY